MAIIAQIIAEEVAHAALQGEVSHKDNLQVDFDTGGELYVYDTATEHGVAHVTRRKVDARARKWQAQGLLN